MLPGVASANAPSDIALDRARDLYYSASYEQALAMLDQLRGTAAGTHIDQITVEQYRAGCLFALGRWDEAEDAMERAVTYAPHLAPEELGLSPRLVAAFASVRARVLAELEHERQAARTLAQAASAVRQSPTFYTIDDLDVTRPAIVQESVPVPPRMRGVDFRGSLRLEVEISAEGTVENVTVREGIHPIYDALILDAAKRWRYEPALRNGQPVRFLKSLRIDVS
jgi:TonB family protein